MFKLKPVLMCLVCLGPAIALAAPTREVAPATTPSPLTSSVPSTSVTVDERPPTPVPSGGRQIATFPELFRTLEATSSDLRISVIALDRAEAATRIAWGVALPTANGSISLSHSSAGGGLTSTGGFFSSKDTLSAQISVSLPLVNLRAWNNIGTARELEANAALSFVEVRRKVALGLARAALSMAAAEKSAALNRVGLETALERLELTRKRLRAGVGSSLDLVRAMQDVAAARAVIPPTDEALRQAREGIGTLLNLATEVHLTATLAALETQVDGFCGAATKSVERSDVLLAKRQIEIAKRNVNDILLKFWPTLSVNLNVGMFGNAFAGPYGASYSITGVLSIPLYDGGIRYGEKRDRLAQVEEAHARVLATEVAARIEAAQARRAISVAEATRDVAVETRNLAREVDRLARLSYERGIGTNFDLIDAGRRLRETEQQLVLRDLEVTRARVTLPFVEGRCVLGR